MKWMSKHVLIGITWVRYLRCWAKFAALLLFVAAIQASAQSAPGGEGAAEETQVRGFWTDPSTGLMWSGKDNGEDVSWHQAMKYCRNLRLASYSDWRLAKMAELQGILNSSANSPGLAGPSKKQRAVTWHVKGNLFLTGNQWANDQSGHTSSAYHSYFDFNEGRANNQPSGFPYSSSFMRALCVRGSGK